MLRCSALLFVALVPTLAMAQVPGMTQIVEAKVEKGQFVWTDVQMKPIVEEIEAQTIVGGKIVTEKRTVISFKLVSTKRTTELKDLKATDTSGKAIPADKLTELLKENTDVVSSYGPLSEKHRSLFQDKVIFVELPRLPPEIK